MTFLATELSLEVHEVEMMVVDMILDNKLLAKIDQIQGFVEVCDPADSLDSNKMKALTKWADAISLYSESFYSKLS